MEVALVVASGASDRHPQGLVGDMNSFYLVLLN